MSALSNGAPSPADRRAPTPSQLALGFAAEPANRGTALDPPPPVPVIDEPEYAADIFESAADWPDWTDDDLDLRLGPDPVAAPGGLPGIVILMPIVGRVE